ncbi:hypothetical protein ACFV1C_23890 [Streptomyces sp. NPDC059605]|uniref:hypothetical protein n=1 Tax=unclassified Streptomyces TaxID=2593676 RepID=UPI0036AA5A8B
MNIARSTAVRASAAALTLLGVLSASVPAVAADPPQGDFTATGVRIHSGYKLDSPVRGHGNPGDGYTWMGGQSTGADEVRCPDGQVKDHWTYIHNNRTGVEGYVSDCFIREN